jgi:hypothetical protein
LTYDIAAGISTRRVSVLEFSSSGIRVNNILTVNAPSTAQQPRVFVSAVTGDASLVYGANGSGPLGE